MIISLFQIEALKKMMNSSQIQHGKEYCNREVIFTELHCIRFVFGTWTIELVAIYNNYNI